MELNKLTSAIINDLWGGNLVPLSSRSLISEEQIADECLEVRSSIIKEWYLKGLLNKTDLATAINCVAVDCKDQNKCTCNKTIENAKFAKHFEIPILMDGIGDDAILFIGSTDRTVSYKIYYTKQAIEYVKYKKRKGSRPYVYIERTPNENNMYDCWIFNAPFVENIAVIGIFRDPRQLEQFNCCGGAEYTEMGAISDEIKSRIINRKVQLYRTAAGAATQTA